MSNQAYDHKNSEDYEANTLILNNALQEIEGNKKLKPTVAQLSKMTGIHRNTITNRVEPVQKLKQIKEARKAEKELLKEQASQNTSDSKASLKEKLGQTQIEVIYWFNEYQDMKRFFEHSNTRFEQMKESRDHYKMLYETTRKSLLDAKQEIERLKELLELQDIRSDQLKH